MAAPVLGPRPLDRLRARLGIFRGGMDRQFAIDQAAKAGPGAGAIETAFFGHRGRLIHKWHHFMPLYDRYFDPLRRRDRPVRLLEIGIADGGSLELWRGYFGKDAAISGIDISPACAAYDGELGNRVRIGSQSDPAFLRAVVEEMGGLDIVIDDGSHMSQDMRASFDVLFPLMAEGGLYVAEDLHTAYWRNFGGGYNSKRSFIGLCKTLIDDMHHWYHPLGERIVAGKGHVAGVHLHDSIAFIEKRHMPRPVVSFRGTGKPLERT
jgi:hypothetical protein